MSTRNSYLTPTQRAQSVSLYKSLVAAQDLIDRGERNAGKIAFAIRQVLDAAGISHIDYIALVDPETLVEQDTIAGTIMLALAARIDGVRLIDNLIVSI